MKVTQLRLAGHGAWLPLSVDRVSPELNVFSGPPGTGKSTVAQLAAHLLYGKTEGATRRAADPAAAKFAQPTEGSLEVETPQGRYLLRRHRDGSPLGRLSVATAGGPAVDGRTIRTLLADMPPRLLAALYAVDFAAAPSAEALLDGEFAREFLSAISGNACEGPNVGVPQSEMVCQGHAAVAPLEINSRRIDELVHRRDATVRQIEEQLSAGRRDSSSLEQQLNDLDATLAKRRRRAEELQGQLRVVEGKLAEIAARLRYFSLESAVRQGPTIDETVLRDQIERLDAEIARCRQTLADLQNREATVRRELAEVHPDGTADSASALADERATVGVLERLLDDLDAEVSQLARSHEPGRCVGFDAHARMAPVAQMLRHQLYSLCGQLTEQERAVRRTELHAEARQVARAQTDLSEQLEHLLGRRQSLVHQSQLHLRPLVALPHAPAATHCQCDRHEEFVKGADAMLLGRTDRTRQEEDARGRRTELEQRQHELRAEADALAHEIEQLDAQWQRLQRDRAQVGAGSTLDALRAELSALEAEINRSLAAPTLPVASYPVAPSHRGVWKASDALAQLTGGELTQIRLAAAGRTASIVDRAGHAHEIAALTAAQQDQLYLALTLALVSSFCQRGIDLPLVLDEPLLRQDAAGAAAMAGVLAEFTRQGRQVIVLTDHRDALRRFEAIGVEVRDLDALRRQSPAATVPAPLPRIEPVAAPAEAATTTVRVVRETVGEAAPHLRITRIEDADEPYYLTPDAPIGEFPVLGSDTTRVFAGLKIRTVDDLLAAHAEEVAEQLGRPAISAATVRMWQSHMSLMCFIPGVSLNDAQVLAANDVHSPESLYTVDVRLLTESIDRFLATERGRRFAPARNRFTRERLGALQKASRRHRDRWQQSSSRYAWIEPPTPTRTKPSPRVASTQTPRSVSKPKPQPAGRRRQPHVPRFLLQPSSAVADAPSIGPAAAERLAKIGIRTVADLLHANPESAAEEINALGLTPAMFARWQCESRLACRIPDLRSYGARVLAASGFTEPEQIAAAKADELLKRIRTACRSREGKRILGSSKMPTRRRVAAWIRQAAQMRPLEAA